MVKKILEGLLIKALKKKTISIIKREGNQTTYNFVSHIKGVKDYGNQLFSISEKEILEKLLSNGALSAYEISLITYSEQSDVEDKLEELQTGVSIDADDNQKKLVKKLLELEGEQFYSLSLTAKTKSE